MRKKLKINRVLIFCLFCFVLFLFLVFKVSTKYNDRPDTISDREDGGERKQDYLER